jgi:hypothetical protein
MKQTELQKALLVVLEHMTQGKSPRQGFIMDMEGMGKVKVLVIVEAVEEETPKIILSGAK